MFKAIPKGPWILKPGESTNRGQWITIHTKKKSLMEEMGKGKVHENGDPVTHIVQKYIDPLLYN